MLKMLNFLKKIFQNEEQELKKAREISLQNLEEWLNEQAKPLAEELRQQTEEILMRVNEELQRARFNVEVLENAKLQNPNIPFKAKQYMEGNRKAYARAINSFLGHMEINNRDYFYLLDFSKEFDSLINDLNKGTLRSYTILQEFFANETNKIAQNLKNFDTLFSELKKVLKNERMESINNAMGKIQSLKARIKQKINVDVDFKGAEAGTKLAIEEKNSIMAEIEKFNKSGEHNDFLRLNEEKKGKANAFYNDESRILQSFSLLDRPLRKYSHIAFEHEEIVLDYLKQPIETLANDKSLAILEILKSLGKMLQENKLQIDDRKREKSLEEIKKLNKEFFEQFLKKYFSFKAEMEGIENRIKASGVPEKFRNFNKQLEESNLRIEKNNEEFDRLKNEVAKIDNAITGLTSGIEACVKEIFDEEIKVLQNSL
ncbi:hypothetical protein HYY71_01760 [Candidatus Woesearchaeota archaeon]|nr:hypothetical protein [Candidatus Woesearchaeota archaeon]